MRGSFHKKYWSGSGVTQKGHPAPVHPWSSGPMDMIGFDVEHRMHLDPASPDPPLLAHPFSPVHDFDPSTVNSNDCSMREDSGIDVH